MRRDPTLVIPPGSALALATATDATFARLATSRERPSGLTGAPGQEPGFAQRGHVHKGVRVVEAGTNVTITGTDDAPIVAASSGTIRGSGSAYTAHYFNGTYPGAVSLDYIDAVDYGTADYWNFGFGRMVFAQAGDYLVSITLTVSVTAGAALSQSYRTSFDGGGTGFGANMQVRGDGPVFSGPTSFDMSGIWLGLNHSAGSFLSNSLEIEPVCAAADYGRIQAGELFITFVYLGAPTALNP